MQDREEALKWTRAALEKPPGALAASQLACLRHLARLRVDDARAQAVEAQVIDTMMSLLCARCSKCLAEGRCAKEWQREEGMWGMISTESFCRALVLQWQLSLSPL